MFLIGHICNISGELDRVVGISLNKRLQFLARLRQDLRSRFQKEYPGQLDNLKLVKETGELKIGSAVHLEQDNVKRLFPAMWRIKKLQEWRDGKIWRKWECKWKFQELESQQSDLLEDFTLVLEAIWYYPGKWRSKPIYLETPSTGNIFNESHLSWLTDCRECCPNSLPDCEEDCCLKITSLS